MDRPVYCIRKWQDSLSFDILDLHLDLRLAPPFCGLVDDFLTAAERRHGEDATRRTVPFINL